MQKKVRFISLAILFVLFFVMLGYTFFIYTSDRPHFKRIITTTSPTPTSGPVKPPSRSYNMVINDDLLSVLVPTIVQHQTGNAGQSATPLLVSQ